jgi:hypothetical protein
MAQATTKTKRKHLTLTLLDGDTPVRMNGSTLLGAMDFYHENGGEQAGSGRFMHFTPSHDRVNNST